jgi:predicted Zn finger-like uncharacterized protein
MPILVGCPSCGGKLRVADELIGQRVRCPSCNQIFDSSAEPLPPPSKAPSPRAGVIDLDLSLDEPTAPPPPPESPPLEPRRPKPILLEESSRNWDVPDIRLRGPRRDAEPDRGTMVLVLGILSLVTILMYCLAPIGAILGIVAWVMGHKDLAKMKAGTMDDRGRGTTQAGWICGIIGTVLNLLLTLGCGVGIGVIWYQESTRPPYTAPMPPPPPGQGWKQAPPKQNRFPGK